MLKPFPCLIACTVVGAFVAAPCSAQKTPKAEAVEKFDILTYKTPKGWQKNVSAAAVQLGVDGAGGTCLISLFKSATGTTDPKANFSASWDAIVKGTLGLAVKPTSRPTVRSKGWTAESGSAPYEVEGRKGTLLLITMTGNQKVVNILVLTNSDAYQKEVTEFLGSVDLPKIVTAAAPVTEKKATPPAAPGASAKSGFKFTTTNFDDGWAAVEEKAWARITKGNVTALVHFPDLKADAYTPALQDALVNAWNVLVAPRYTKIRDLQFRPILSYESISFAEADAQDIATGRDVHIILFKKHFSGGQGKYIEFVTPSKAEFEKVFGPYHETASGWDKLEALQAKNRFAVDSGDLAGKWSTSASNSLSYYYVNGGGYAGAVSSASSSEFSFTRTGSYSSSHGYASGVVGAQKFDSAAYKGTFVTTSWTVKLTNRFKGKAGTYDCYFEAVRGGRILVLSDKGGVVYSLVRK